MQVDEHDLYDAGRTGSCCDQELLFRLVLMCTAEALHLTIFLGLHSMLTEAIITCMLSPWPQVFHQDVLASLLAPESSQYAVRTAVETFVAYRDQGAVPIFSEHFTDPLNLSEGLTGDQK